MNALLDAIGPFGWWIVGLVLLALELAVPGVYFLFLGIAAIVVGTNALLLGTTGWFGWQEQVVAFVVVSLAAAVVGRRWYGSPNAKAETEGSLNIGAERLVGRTAVLSEPITNGRGRAAIDDGWWTVEGPDLPAGTRVRVTAVSGSVLVVVPADRP